jgi:hypothetical protein
VMVPMTIIHKKGLSKNQSFVILIFFFFIFLLFACN